MNIKIALVDDHHLVRSGLKLLLESSPSYKVVLEAGHGREFIDALNKQGTRPDIALIDVTMPIMDGFELCREMEEHHSDIKIIALSIHDDLSTANKMIEAGANAYLLKDTSWETVQETINCVFQKGYYYSQFVMDSFMPAKELDQFKVQSISPYKRRFPTEHLTEREIEFIKNCCSEKTYKEIADSMKVSQRTVDGYRESVFSKLQLKSRTGIVLYAIHNRFIIVN